MLLQGYLATVDMFPAFRRLEIVSSAFPWFSCPGFLGRRGGVSDKGAPGSLDGDRGPPNSQQAHVFLQLRDCGGLREVEVTACLVWKDWPHRVHPHSLVGKDCTDGVCRVRLRPHVSPRHRYQTLTSDPQLLTSAHRDSKGEHQHLEKPRSSASWPEPPYCSSWMDGES